MLEKALKGSPRYWGTLIGLGLVMLLGMGFWLSAPAAKYRDFRIIVPFVVQLGFYVSPVGYATGIVPEKYRLYYDLNPLVGLIDAARWSLLQNAPAPRLATLIASLALTLGLLLTGAYYFRSREREFADVI